MLNPPLILVSALFFLALVSALYLVSWLSALAVLRVGKGRLSHAAAKRVLMTALILPPLLSLLPTVSGATLRHLHEPAKAAHHTEGCAALFERLAALGSLGGGAISAAMHGGTWILLFVGAFLVARLVRATVRLERGIVPFLSAPSPRLAQSLWRVQGKLSRLPAARFFECPIPASYSSVLGFFKARCVLSQAFVASASEEELDAVVAHETGHLLGRDVVATFFVGALNCLFFFLRPVRLLARRWREAAELAADDAAVAATQNPLGMAAAILKVSGASLPTTGNSAAVLAARLPAVALPFADEAACAPSVRVERLMAHAQNAASLPPPQGESRAATLVGWLITGVFAAVGTVVLLSAEAACFSHCTLEVVSRLL